MKASKFSDPQKAFILKQGADGLPPTEMQRLKLLEDENAKAPQAGGRPVARPRHAAGRHLASALRPARKRKLADAVCDERDVSIRRAWMVLEVDRSACHHKSRRPDQAGLEARIKEICATRVRYGYRRVHVVLQREGWDVNVKKTQPLSGKRPAKSSKA